VRGFWAATLKINQLISFFFSRNTQTVRTRLVYRVLGSGKYNTAELAYDLQLMTMRQATAFETRWPNLWPKNLPAASLADWRRKDGYSGASPLEVIMGLDSQSYPHSRRKRGQDLNSLP